MEGSIPDSHEVLLPGNRIITNSEFSGIIKTGNYFLDNNAWGKTEDSFLSQSIYFDSSSGTMGWQWNIRKDPLHKIPEWEIRGYPEIVYGKEPWRNFSTVPDMPVKVSDFKKHVLFDYELSAEGKYNTAFLIYIVKDRNPTHKDIFLELMIWVENSGLRGPAPDVRKKLSLDGRNFLFEMKRDYHLLENRWIFTRFICEHPMRSGELSLGEFVRFILEEGLIPPDYYVANIDFGNEIVKGNGLMKLNRYEIK